MVPTQKLKGMGNGGLYNFRRQEQFVLSKGSMVDKYIRQPPVIKLKMVYFNGIDMWTSIV